MFSFFRKNRNGGTASVKESPAEQKSKPDTSKQKTPTVTRKDSNKKAAQPKTQVTESQPIEPTSTAAPVTTPPTCGVSSSVDDHRVDSSAPAVVRTASKKISFAIDDTVSQTQKDDFQDRESTGQILPPAPSSVIPILGDSGIPATESPCDSAKGKETLNPDNVKATDSVVVCDDPSVRITEPEKALVDLSGPTPLSCLTVEDVAQSAGEPSSVDVVAGKHNMATETATDTSFDTIRLMEDRVRQLESELCAKNHRLEQLEATIRADGDRQAQLETLERFEAEWIKERELIDNERDEELRILQEALEEALEEKAEMESKMLRDASRESQLLDDFEWKLGEIERDYKKKVTEAEKATEERVKREMAAEYQQLIDDKQDIDKKLAEIAHLKSYEAEVTQLRGLIHEQQRAIRVASRQVDQLRVNERQLQDDLKKLSAQGCTRKQAQEMEEKWEEKAQSECNRLRAELLAANEEEMLKAIRQVVREKDEQIATLKRQFESQLSALTHQVNELNKALQEQEAKAAKRLEAARTDADRDLWDLRRQLNKAQDLQVELLEQAELRHAKELEQCKLINGGELITLEKSFECKLQEVEVQHQSQLNALQSLIEEEKQEALTQLGEHYRNQLQSLQEHIADQQKKWAEIERMKDEEIGRLRKTVAEQTEQIEVLQSRNQAEIDSNSIRSTESETSDEDDEDLQPSPPNGRSAGDGASPSTSAAASQDNLNPVADENNDRQLVKKTMMPVATSTSPDPASCQACDDPEHLEAQQIILEMHQVLADRDAELQRLTEEKRFYQLELIHWERNLALQRAGLPLALVPDQYSSDDSAGLNSWRGFSAPPVTKPRLPELQQHFMSASAAYGDNSRAASYEVLSPTALSFSPEPSSQHLVPGDGDPYSSGPFFGLHYQHPVLAQPLPGSSRYYSDDDDDDSNNNGFTTPL